MKFPLKILSIIAPSVILLDQWTKSLVVEHLALGERIAVIEGFFDWVHVRNTGAAFGMMAAAPEWFRVPFFYGISVIAIGVLTVFFWKIKPEEKFLSIPFSLIAAGVVGNLIDRLRYGNVVDFVSWHLQDKFEWPAFNVADSAITISMFLILISVLKSGK